ncbi:HMG box-containing protein 4 [Halichoeres trimaculatus]|uniref:HMG box-containing protein 4 n=1 Tax=Halichoeres trimaculatus TaxID=147232 RepID=UPI003D9DC72C
MAVCPSSRTTSLPVTPEAHRPCTVIPVPGPVLYPMISSPMAATYSPIPSMCSPISSAWDTLRPTTRSPGRFNQDPVRAAAHLHLLGESLFLIGQFLQETNKTVSVPGSLSLLLDSLLCALVPLISLTSQIPELRESAQHKLCYCFVHLFKASTLENIDYLMPGL